VRLLTPTSTPAWWPPSDGVIRLVGAVLSDIHDDWQAGDRR